MVPALVVPLLVATAALAATYPAPGGPKGAGKLPISVSTIDDLGFQSSNISIIRDLGFTGVVSGQIIWTYGDTERPNNSGPGFASDSVAIGNINTPTKVYDKNVNSGGFPNYWIPYTSYEANNGGISVWAEGGTNVVEVAPGRGIVYYLTNYRPNGNNHIIGAGVATVNVNASGAFAHRPFAQMWNASVEPYWDICAVNGQDGYVYVYGNGPQALGYFGYVYLARVPTNVDQTDVTKYSYWNGKSFDNNRLNTAQRLSTSYVFGKNEQSQSTVHWSNYYNVWFMVGASAFGGEIKIRTATSAAGPWSSSQLIQSLPASSSGASGYTILSHPEYDDSGKTLLVTYTSSPDGLRTHRLHFS